MKVKLIVTKELEQQFKEAVEYHKLQYSDEATIVVYELHQHQEFVMVKDKEEYLRIAIRDILYISATGNNNYVHTTDTWYLIRDTMYQLEASLYEKGFLRIHKAYIVQKKAIKRIKAGLNMKFVLLLINGDQIEVSRSYYYQFKEEMGF